MNNLYRHGDVSFHPVNAVPQDAKEVTPKTTPHRFDETGRYIVAFGEVTGHKHRLASDAMRILKDPKNAVYVEVKSQGTITHEEHRKLNIQPGIYKIEIERQYDPFENATRRVID